MKNYFQKVYEIVTQIPPGKVATYGQIAALLGEPRGARTVGWAMQKAPDHLNLPCHRVVNKPVDLAPDTFSAVRNTNGNYLKMKE